MKRIINIVLIIVILLSLSLFKITYAISENIKLIKEQATPIDSNQSILTKKITKIDNNEVTINLSLNIKDNEIINSDSEILFLIDNSSSMETILQNQNETRKNKVILSTEKLIDKVNSNNPNVKMGICIFSDGKEIVQSFTNNKELLINGCEKIKNKKTGNVTNMFSALKYSKKIFGQDVSNKILVLLTDGLPTENYNSTRVELMDNNVYIISALVGLSNNNNEKIKSIFGNEQNPTADKFYRISDNDIETIISNDIYNRILSDFQGRYTNIEIKDYFPEDILNNFTIEIEDSSKGEVVLNDNKILWNIDSLENKENANLNYKLILKENYNKDIINKILNTNKKVELNYTDIYNSTQNKEMLDSPQIIIKSLSVNNENNLNNNANNELNKNNNNSTDTTNNNSNNSNSSDTTNNSNNNNNNNNNETNTTNSELNNNKGSNSNNSSYNVNQKNTNNSSKNTKNDLNTNNDQSDSANDDLNNNNDTTNNNNNNNNQIDNKDNIVNQNDDNNENNNNEDNGLNTNKDSNTNNNTPTDVNTNSNNNSRSSEQSTNNNSQKNTKQKSKGLKDNTTINEKIPYAGNRSFVLLLIVILTITTIITYKKYKNEKI